MMHFTLSWHQGCQACLWFKPGWPGTELVTPVTECWVGTCKLFGGSDTSLILHLYKKVHRQVLCKGAPSQWWFPFCSFRLLYLTLSVRYNLA